MPLDRCFIMGDKRLRVFPSTKETAIIFSGDHDSSQDLASSVFHLLSLVFLCNLLLSSSFSVLVYNKGCNRNSILKNKNVYFQVRGLEPFRSS